MKLWQKNSGALQEVEKFTVGMDREIDLYLAPYDILGSLAHVQMLATVGLLEQGEMEQIRAELRNIYEKVENGDFVLDADVEDIHSQIELLLTKKLGEAGKKIHSARSRNDQVLVDIRLFMRDALEPVVEECVQLFALLQSLSEKHRSDLLPGYTHLQAAMPSSFGLWFGAYAESLADDLVTVRAAYDLVNRNPLGSAAGYGSSFPINRNLTTQLLGFEGLNYNVVYAQMGRGRIERIVVQSLGNIADTLARLSMDACLYLNPNFDFIAFPAELTTGSSIMPHKKNPDVFELIRARSNRLKALPNEINQVTANLPSGYHRDMQILKENVFPAFGDLLSCLQMMQLMLNHIEVKQDLLKDERYRYLFSVEEVNRLVNRGVPFRDAYKEVGLAIENGSFSYSTDIHHTHEGSIGDPGSEVIRRRMEGIVSSFPFTKVDAAISSLLGR